MFWRLVLSPFHILCGASWGPTPGAWFSICIVQRPVGGFMFLSALWAGCSLHMFLIFIFKFYYMKIRILCNQTWMFKKNLTFKIKKNILLMRSSDSFPGYSYNFVVIFLFKPEGFFYKFKILKHFVSNITEDITIVEMRNWSKIKSMYSVT